MFLVNIKMYFHQLRLLLWKNYIIKKRSWLVLVFELIVPLVLFLIMTLIRIKQQAKPVDMVYYNAWPLPSAGLIPIMQGFCDPSNGLRNEKGFLEYPNATAEDMLIKINKLVSLNLTGDDFFKNDKILNWSSNSSKRSDDSDSGFHRVISDLASLASHLPHGLCKSKKPEDIIKNKDQSKKKRPESLVSESTGQFDNSSKEKLNKDLEKNLGFIGLWFNMQKTFCGVEIPPKQQHNEANSTSNSTNSMTDHDDQNTFSGSVLSKNQLQSVSLIFHVIYSNPVILYSPDTPVIRHNLIKKANGTFELIDAVNKFSLQWLNVSGSLVKNIGNSTGSSRDLIDKIDLIDSAACSWLQLMSDINLDVFKGFSNESDLVDYFLHRAYDDNVTVIASLVFDVENKTPAADRLDPFLKYKIRQNASFTYTTKKIRERYWYPSPRDWDYYYYIFGFTWLQDLIERAFIDYHSNTSVLEPGSYLNQMPYPCYMIDNFLQMIQHVMPLCLSISFVYTVAMLSQTIVIEKELRLKEVMKIMGLNNTVHMLAWFITYFIQFSLIMIIVTLILHFGKILTHSNPFVIFFMLEVFAISTICFSFLVSSLYSKAKIAAACAGIMYFLSYVPCMYISIREDVAMEIVPWWAKALASLLSTSAFGIASKYIAFYENDGTGMQWHNMNSSPLENDTFNCLICIKLMIFDWFLYWILAWYIENVNPSYGIPLPICYPFKLEYWLGNSWRKEKNLETQNNDEPVSVGPSFIYYLFLPFSWCRQKLASRHQHSNLSYTDQEQSNLINKQLEKTSKSYCRNKKTCLLEPEPLNLSIGVSVQNLTKKYDDSKLAVDNLSINFYESQITSFLGHNGAGKTTTISLLTGLLPATSGHAIIYNKDIRTDINEIRSNMGWCPQHNILFEKLTVEEHLWFFAKLKQINEDSIDGLIENLLRDTGLSEKRTSKIDTLSGGMKRKLSVAIAFVGNASLVILDEPTAGVDPYARRAIWDLLLKYKQNRTIILSTHHMDEAELLGDRIAIISNGRLQCCGSSLFLKNALGEGNHLTIVKDLPKIEAKIKLAIDEEIETHPEIIRSSITAEITNRILEFIQIYVPSAFLKDETLREYQFVIPLSERCNPKFWELFEDLEKAFESLKIESYGVHDVSLEEIFIKAADLDYNQKKTINDSESAGEDKVEEEKKAHCADEHDSLYNLDDIYKSLETGYSLYLKQVYATVVKRCLYNRRNWKSMLTQIVLPASFICIAMTVALSAPGFFDLPELELTPAQFWPLTEKEGGLSLPYNYDLEETSRYNKCTETKKGIEASSVEIAKTLKYLIGIGSTCVLNKANLSINDIILHPPSSNPNLHFNSTYFGHSSLCLSVFNQKANIYPININTTMTTIVPDQKKLTSKKYYPTCVCLKDLSGFECQSKETIDSPEEFKTITHETLLNISGTKNENDYYLYTTDMFRLRRYGGLSFDNEACSSNKPEQKSINRLVKRLKTDRRARVWYNNKAFHAMPTFLNTMNNAILRANVLARLRRDSRDRFTEAELLIETARYGIMVSNHPMNQTNNYLSTEFLLQGSDVLISIFTIVAMSFVNASFVLFLVYERSIKSMHLQFLIGLNPFLYWLTNFVWDMFNYLLPASCVIIILKVFDVPAYVQGQNFPAVISLFILYGWSVSPLMYPFTFIFKEPSNAYIFLIVINLFTGITCVESSFLFQVFSFDKDLKLMYDGVKTLFLIFPPYCLGRGLIDIAYNDYYNEFYTKTGQTHKIRSPFEWDIASEKLLVMAIIGVLAWVFTLLLEYEFFKFKWLTKAFKLLFKCQNASSLSIQSELINNSQKNTEDSDVNFERVRCQQIIQKSHDNSESQPNTDQLIIHELKKVYTKKNAHLSKQDTGFLAVENLTFGVPAGECFGLLGVNGAGKTTTFKMLTTDLKPTSGSIYVSDSTEPAGFIQGLTNLKTYWSRIGYCPQFDALYDELTPADHIRLFSRLKGVKSEMENRLVQALLKRLDLVQYEEKPCGSLSLGNKRKVSTALCLVGNPSIVLLDEPTSGMDPMSRRKLWQEIINLTRIKNHSVLFTSHSMEECENLCTRLAIMVDGKFKCLGSVQHLKTKFGDGYTLTVKIKETGSDKDKYKYVNLILDKLRQKINARCQLKERNFNNVFQFDLPYPTVSTKEKSSDCSHPRLGGLGFNIGCVYKLIELNKLRFNVTDYSLSQNTLDNVFIKFVKEHTSQKKIMDENERRADVLNCLMEDDEMLVRKRAVHFPINDNDEQLIDLNDDNFIDFGSNRLSLGDDKINFGFKMEQMEIMEN